VRWIVDTSAWSRRDIPEVRAQLTEILAEEQDSELVLSPSVLLELMRGPQGDEVARERERLTAGMETLAADARTFELAAGAMECLASVGPEAHRLPVPDLITAALAHQHACGVVHVDEDFELLARRSGLEFEQRRIELPGDRSGSATGHPQANKQRALKQELSQLLHRKPVAEAEEILERVVRELREGDSG
jgi:predicted nucleic acid-binding protein